MLTDAQWIVLEPLVEAVRPHAKVPPSHLRRTMGAILWRHDNGAKWRSLPAEHGPWWMAAQTFIRWARRGVGPPADPSAGARRATWHDVPRRHQHPGPPQGGGRGQKASTPAQRDGREALGRSRGGYGTKACVITDAIGRAVAFVSAPGQVHELPHAVALLDQLPDIPGWVVADRGYSSHGFREHIRDLGAKPAIPPRNNKAPVACADWIYVHRNQVERLWARLKEWLAVATRYEKTACSYMGVLSLAAAMDWIRH